MLGQEEFVQQPVHLQQPLAAQAQRIVVDAQKSALLQRAELLGEAAENIDSEFVLEVAPLDASQLHLEDEFPDHPLLGRWGERPINRKPALPHFRDVWAELMLVLEMRAADVRERRDAQTDHIGPGPQQVAIEEAALG